MKQTQWAANTIGIKQNTLTTIFTCVFSPWYYDNKVVLNRTFSRWKQDAFAPILKVSGPKKTYTTCLKAFWPTDLQCSTCWGQVTRRSWTRPYWKRQPALAILRSYVRYLNRGPWLKHCSVSVGVSVVSESKSSPVESNRVSMEVEVEMGVVESSRIQMRQRSFIDLTVGQFTVTQW